MKARPGKEVKPAKPIYKFSLFLYTLKKQNIFDQARSNPGFQLSNGQITLVETWMGKYVRMVQTGREKCSDAQEALLCPSRAEERHQFRSDTDSQLAW